MRVLKFHAIGEWPRGRVRCQWVPSSFHPDADALNLIEQSWQSVNRRPGVHLFDGPMCRLEAFSSDADELRLSLSPVSYKPFLGTNLQNPQLAEKSGWQALANPLGVSCALLSSDGALMMGQRNQQVAYYPGRIHP